MLYDKLLSLNLIKKCWEEIYYSKTDDVRRISKGIDNVSLKKFEQNKENYLAEMLTELRNRDYKFQPLKGEFRKKKSGKYRLLTVPTVKDRIVHRMILTIITPELYGHINTGVSYCGVSKNISKGDHHKKNKGLNLRNAIKELIAQIKEKKFWFFESDIKGFFDYVPKAKLLNKLLNFLPDDSLAGLLKQIIFFDLGNEKEILKNKKSQSLKLPNDANGISQGSALSPLFSNVYLADFDVKMKNKCGKGLIRYVDDFIIAGETKREVEELGQYAKDVLLEEELELSPEKTDVLNLMVCSMEFLGLKISRNKITCRKTVGEVIGDFNEKKIQLSKYKEISRKIKNGNIVVTKLEQINEKIEGWVNTYRFYHMEAIFCALRDLIKKRKNKDSRLEDLTVLEDLKMESIIDLDDWKNMFLNKDI